MTINLCIKKLLSVFALVIATSFVFSQVSFSQASSEKVLHTFVFSDVNNAALSADYVGVIDLVEHTVTIPDLPIGTEVTALTPDFSSSDISNVWFGKSFTPAALLGSGLGSGTKVVGAAAIDLSVAGNRRIIVEAEDHSTAYYTLILGSPTLSDKDILMLIVTFLQLF